jgi:hypothetical protein
MVNANVLLTLLEWWNNPPTKPQFDDAQIAGIFADIIDGGVAILDGPGKNKTETVLNLFDLKYPRSIVVPPKGMMVFQVSVETDIYFLGAGFNTASIRINNNDSFVVCPFVQFQVTEDVVTKGPPLP